jgi:hypothetical protein
VGATEGAAPSTIPPRMRISRPPSTSITAARRLSWGLAILMVVQAAVGLSIPSLYRDEDWVRATWFGNDLVTLLVAVPLLIWSLLRVPTGSRRAELVWYSMLGYSVYNYGFYLFGAALNWFFPAYVVLFAVPIFALILALGRLDADAVAGDFSSSTPRRWVGGYMLFTGVGLTLAWLGQWATFMLTGSAPSIGAEAFQLIAAMDLSFMVPWFLLGAVLLLRQSSWGYVIAPIIVMKGATYTLVLTVASTVAATRDIEGSAAQIPVWAAWTLLGVLALWGLFGHLPPGRRIERATI